MEIDILFIQEHREDIKKLLEEQKQKIIYMYKLYKDIEALVEQLRKHKALDDKIINDMGKTKSKKELNDNLDEFKKNNKEAFLLLEQGEKKRQDLDNLINETSKKIKNKLDLKKKEDINFIFNLIYSLVIEEELGINDGITKVYIDIINGKTEIKGTEAENINSDFLETFDNPVLNAVIVAPSYDKWALNAETNQREAEIITNKRTGSNVKIKTNADRVTELLEINNPQAYKLLLIINHLFLTSGNTRDDRRHAITGKIEDIKAEAVEQEETAPTEEKKELIHETAINEIKENSGVFPNSLKITDRQLLSLLGREDTKNTRYHLKEEVKQLAQTLQAITIKTEIIDSKHKAKFYKQGSILSELNILEIGNNYYFDFNITDTWKLTLLDPGQSVRYFMPKEALKIGTTKGSATNAALDNALNAKLHKHATSENTINQYGSKPRLKMETLLNYLEEPLNLKATIKKDPKRIKNRLEKALERLKNMGLIEYKYTKANGQAVPLNDILKMKWAEYESIYLNYKYLKLHIDADKKKQEHDEELKRKADKKETQKAILEAKEEHKREKSANK